MDEPVRLGGSEQEAVSLAEALQQAVAEIKKSRARIEADQRDIDRLTGEKRSLREETRAILDTLRPAA